MIFDIITIFPHIFDSYLKESFIKKAQESGKISIRIHDLRSFTKDRHKSVDDRPYGGGLGMVLKVEPIYKALHSLKLKSKNLKLKTILFTPRGKKFNQQLAYKLSKLDRIVFICGRYEGVDERVAKNLADIELSIGDYDLMGGELPAMVVMETIARLIPGVLGKPEFLKERITKEKGFIEYPQYTRPPQFIPKKLEREKTKVWKVPKVLLSGNHKKIEEWRKKYGRDIGK
ncbi:MAG: tRNA (guanosine(37)-N1)-methyltransferase TrmD [Candidatus Pacebacteria bacterium]|nr:tRNA (guanosine(37)-N1)-methyltransferase TrmD [Candidatus Paceibacterota bacterium]